MKRAMTGLMAAGLVAAMAGCKSQAFLDQRTESDRAKYGDSAIIVPPPPPPHVDIVNPDPSRSGLTMPTEETQVVGTWTFTTPPTVTRVQHRTGNMDQFSLYNGRPAPTDTPFLVITVTRDRDPIAPTEPTTYKIANQRDYVLNGQVAHEWTGNTNTGAGFCELIVNKVADARGDVCHAMATAKNVEEQKLALDILASIVWAPAKGSRVDIDDSAPHLVIEKDLKSVSFKFVKGPNGVYTCVSSDIQ